MSYKYINLNLQHIQSFRRFIFDNSFILINHCFSSGEWNSICANGSRIEDIAGYLNEKELGANDNFGCAFDLVEFLLHASVMINCINTITEIIGEKNNFKETKNFFTHKSVTNRNALDKRLANLTKRSPYKNEDDLYFEYIRSIGATHPNSTNHHEYFQHFNEESSPFLLWNRFIGLTGGDISLHIYDSSGKDEIYSLKLYLNEIYAYISDRYSRLILLEEKTKIKHSNAIKKLKTEKIPSKTDFKDYEEYLLCLEKEASRRSEGFAFYISNARKILNANIPSFLSPSFEKYKNAIIFAIEEARTILQGPVFNDNYSGENLLSELLLPRLLPKDSPEMSSYYYEKTGYLYSEQHYNSIDLKWFRRQAILLFDSAHNYIPVDKNELEKLSNIELLATLNTALYLYSISHNTFINKAIPKTKMYR